MTPSLKHPATQINFDVVTTNTHLNTEYDNRVIKEVWEIAPFEHSNKQ